MNYKKIVFTIICFITIPMFFSYKASATIQSLKCNWEWGSSETGCPDQYVSGFNLAGKNGSSCGAYHGCGPLVDEGVSCTADYSSQYNSSQRITYVAQGPWGSYCYYGWWVGCKSDNSGKNCGCTSCQPPYSPGAGVYFSSGSVVCYSPAPGTSCDYTRIEKPDDTPTNTPTRTPTNTPTNTPTKTPTNTPTRTPTNTPTITPTITNTPIVPVPTCPPSSCFTDPEIVYPNTTTAFKAQISGTETRVKNATVTSDGFNCPNPPFTRIDVNGVAQIYWNCGTPISNNNYNLTLSYKYSSATNPAVLSEPCSCSVNKTISGFPGYLRTEGGDMYVRSYDNPPQALIDMLVYPTNDPSKSLSTYNLSLSGVNGDIQLNNLPADCSGSICSTKRYLLWDYSDDNGPDSTGGYYDQIYAAVMNQVSKNGALTVKTFEDDTSYDDPANFNTDVVIVKGNLTFPPFISTTCNRKTIFFIEDILYLGRTFENTSISSACMFVVKGKTTANASKFQVEADQVEAFIITKDFESIDSPSIHDQLTIKGGLIIGNDVIFGRNMNSTPPLQSTPNPDPSELIIYEGARYIKNLGHILSMPTRLDIQEKLP